MPTDDLCKLYLLLYLQGFASVLWYDILLVVAPRRFVYVEYLPGLRRNLFAALLNYYVAETDAIYSLET